MPERRTGAVLCVSAARVSRWRRRTHFESDPRPRAPGGDRRSARIEAHRALILGVPAEAPVTTVGEQRCLLAGHRLDFDHGTVQRFLIRQPMTRRMKTGHASEQDRPDALDRRHVWQEGQTAHDPARLVFIDETWTKTKLTRTHGRALEGRHLRMGQPHSRAVSRSSARDTPCR